MTKISKKFTYDIADDYLAQTNEQKKTAEWTYDGEDKIWVFVDKETNKIRHTNFYTEAENGDEIPTPLDMIKVMINCEENPLLCTLFGADEVKDYNELEQIVEDLPDGNQYVRPKNTTPDHTYDVFSIEYDPTNNRFKEPYPWVKPFITWEAHRSRRNLLLDLSDDKALSDMPESVKQKWEEYRQALRDLPQTYGAAPGELPPIDPWKVRYPVSPKGEE